MGVAPGESAAGLPSANATCPVNMVPIIKLAVSARHRR
jgi:hypothetical protein